MLAVFFFRAQALKDSAGMGFEGENNGEALEGFNVELASAANAYKSPYVWQVL